MTCKEGANHDHTSPEADGLGNVTMGPNPTICNNGFSSSLGTPAQGSQLPSRSTKTSLDLGDTNLGYAYAHTYYARDAYDWTLELSIYVDRNRRQAGIGQALYDVLEEKLSKQNVVNLLACISLPNAPSIRFHQKRGFEQIGHFKKVGFKFGQWRVTVWMQKRLREVAVPEPILYKNGEDVV